MSSHQEFDIIVVLVDHLYNFVSVDLGKGQKLNQSKPYLWTLKCNGRSRVHYDTTDNPGCETLGGKRIQPHCSNYTSYDYQK